MGISGVFTKQLDIALLDGSADIAVHSLKDVPTQMAKGLKLSAVLTRGAHQDVVILKDKKMTFSMVFSQMYNKFIVQQFHISSNQSFELITVCRNNYRIQILQYFSLHQLIC